VPAGLSTGKKFKKKSLPRAWGGGPRQKKFPKKKKLFAECLPG